MVNVPPRTEWLGGINPLRFLQRTTAFGIPEIYYVLMNTIVKL